MYILLTPHTESPKMVTPAFYNKPISEILDYVKLHFPESKYIAKDKSGFWYAHYEKPKYYISTWLSNDLTHELPFIDHNNFSNDLVKIEKTDYKAECEKLKAECEKLKALISENNKFMQIQSSLIKALNEKVAQLEICLDQDSLNEATLL